MMFEKTYLLKIAHIPMTKRTLNTALPTMVPIPTSDSAKKTPTIEFKNELVISGLTYNGSEKFWGTSASGHHCGSSDIFGYVKLLGDHLSFNLPTVYLSKPSSKPNQKVL